MPTSTTSPNRLWGFRTYLCGAIDRSRDGGVGWRREITPKLQKKGIVVMDPCCKPIELACEDVDNRRYRAQLLEKELFDELKGAEIIRGIDLAMVSRVDFLIVNLDISEYPCGTYEEIFKANDQNKPVLIVNTLGKKQALHWLFLMFPHEHIFNNMEELLDYLDYIDTSDNPNNLGRWTFFNYRQLYTL